MQARLTNHQVMRIRNAQLNVVKNQEVYRNKFIFEFTLELSKVDNTGTVTAGDYACGTQEWITDFWLISNHLRFHGLNRLILLKTVYF